MCIMEMRPGQRKSTLYMAIAHNTRTIVSDLDLLGQLMQNRAVTEAEKLQVQHGRENLERAYADFLSLFGEAVGEENQDPEGHAHEHEPAGNERTLVQQADADAKAARAYTTR